MYGVGKGFREGDGSPEGDGRLEGEERRGRRGGRGEEGEGLEGERRVLRTRDAGGWAQRAAEGRGARRRHARELRRGEGPSPRRNSTRPHQGFGFGAIRRVGVGVTGARRRSDDGDMIVNMAPTLPWNALESVGGFASRSELVGLGCSREFIDLCVWYRRILPVRKGWYASRGTSTVILRALRVGGRLACVSALAWHEGRDVPVGEPVHVLVRHGASRLGTGAIVHWSRRDVAGSRTVVSVEAARSQAASCRASRC